MSNKAKLAKSKETECILSFDYMSQISNSFQVDCEDLLESFEKLHSFSYNAFANIWREKNFTHVFAGINYLVLLRSFCENCFYVIKKFLMFPKSQYTQMGAFYLLYGLYYKQPIQSMVKIRVTLEEFKQIIKLIEQMRAIAQMDAVYIFTKLRDDNAFLCVAQRKPLGPEMQFIKDTDLFVNDTFLWRKSDISVAKFNDFANNGQVLKELDATDNEYQNLLKKYAEKCPSLNCFGSSSITDELRQGWLNIQNEQSCTPFKIDNDKEYQSRANLKKKAAANKNAVYRANRTCTTSQDIKDASSNVKQEDK